jgi:methyltransferase (TIGR00027 family)
MGQHLAARTAFFDRVVVAQIEAGTSQVVAVGAGYDGRSMRYAATGVRWIELDHPSTQVDKLSRLRRLGIAIEDVAFAAVDFDDGDIGASLRGAGHDAERPTLFVCEGVAGYLPGPVLTRLLVGLAARASSASTLAITVPLEPESAEARIRRDFLVAAVARMGEPLVFTVSRADLPGFMFRAGWEVGSLEGPSSAFVIARPTASLTG